jgi:hypothetical protein
MKKLILNKILLGFLTIMTLSCYSQTDFIKISNEIYKKNIEHYDNKIAKKSEKTHKKIRKQIFKNGLIPFFKTSEPLFIIEGYDIETDETYTQIWNSIGSMSYGSEKKNYEVIEGNYYSEDLKLLIKDWRIETIKQNLRKEGAYLGGLDFSVQAIYFLENGKIKEIKYFSFSEYNGCMKEIIEYE